MVSGKSFRCSREDVSRRSRHPRRLAAGNLVVDDDVTLRLTCLERESLLLRVEGAKYRYASSLPLRRNGLRWNVRGHQDRTHTQKSRDAYERAVNAFRNLGEVSSLGRLTARNSCEGENRRTINWLRGRRRRRRRIAKTDQAVSRATGLFMHLRDSGFKRVPRTSKQEVPGESRYRSSSWTQIIICRTYSVLYAGMRLLYDATQPMLARDSRLLPSTLTLLFACHSVYTTIFCVCVRMLRKSLRYQRYLRANSTPLSFTLLVYFTTEPSGTRAPSI